MKTKLSQAFFLSFILLLTIPAFTLNAQDSFIISDFEPIMARIDGESRFEIILSAESFSNSSSLYYENELELEDWMLDTGNRGTELNALMNFNVRIEVIEQEIVLEDWMLTPAITGMRLYRDCIREDKEEDIVLEAWML
jgi:hypothetical protein